MNSVAGAPAATQRLHPWSRWVGLLDRREPGTTLALFRIACALCVLASVGAVVTFGVVPALWLDAAHGGYQSSVNPPWLFERIGGATPGNVWLMIGIVLASALLLAVGLGGRVAAFVALQSHMAIVKLNVDAAGSYDGLLANALWLVFLSRSTATLSLDCRLRTGTWTSDRPVPAWPRYLIIYQLVLVYWSTGMHKVSAYWTPVGGFSALYYTLQQPTWQRWDMSWLAWVYPVTQAATAVTWIWEITAPLLLLDLWYRCTPERAGLVRAAVNRLDYRRGFVVIGVTMHVTVWVLMELGPFSWIALSYYLCLFHPAEWHSAWIRLRKQFQLTSGLPQGS